MYARELDMGYVHVQEWMGVGTFFTYVLFILLL
jgi:hypothetical protein